MTVTDSKVDNLLSLHAATLACRAEIEAELNLIYPFPAWYGERDRYYWGPDAQNKRSVLIIGENVNMAITQMEQNGKRHVNKKQ